MKTRYRWWGYAKNVIRGYPSLCAAREETRQTKVVARYSACGGGGGGGTNRPVEAAALRTLRPDEQRELDAVERAIDHTRALKTGEERLAVVQAVFWRGTHTLHGAADLVHVSYRTARRWHFDFIFSVGEELGLTSKIGPQAPF